MLMRLSVRLCCESPQSSRSSDPDTAGPFRCHEAPQSPQCLKVQQAAAPPLLLCHPAQERACAHQQLWMLLLFLLLLLLLLLLWLLLLLVLLVLFLLLLRLLLLQLRVGRRRKSGCGPPFEQRSNELRLQQRNKGCAGSVQSGVTGRRLNGGPWGHRSETTARLRVRGGFG